MVHHHGNTDKGDTKNLMVAFLLNLFFTIIEILGGLFTNSVAILSDAIHDFGDTISLGMAWYLQKLSKKERDSRYSYGYQRYSVLGALINSVILLAGCIFILYETIPRLMHPEEVNPYGMILLAILGIVINGIAVFRLNKGSSLNEKVVSLHLLEDVLGWVAVLIGSIIILIWDVRIIDPILSIGIAIFILFNLYKNIRSTLDVILQRIPKNVDFAGIENFLKQKEFVQKVNDLHVWSLDGEYNIMTVELSVNPDIKLEELRDKKASLHAELKDFNIAHATIEII